jgi:O-antigen/teichoic acid export membrane protein
MQADQNLKHSVVKNASANVLRLAVSGTVALLLPPFLVRMLPPETYGTWALVLQVTTYLAILDFGIQTAVARFVAHAGELRNAEQRDGITSTAFVLLTIAAVAALIVVGILTWQLPNVFKAMPGSLQKDARIALLITGGSFAVGLPVSVIHAVFIGQQRNKIPVGILVANKLLTAALILVVVFEHAGLAAMGAAVGVANLVSYGAAFVAWRVWAPDVKIGIALASKSSAKEIASYCAALGVWYLGMMMVSGLDLTIVGVFDYAAVAYYAVAVTLTNFVVQTQNAIFAAVLPASAVLNARGDSQRLGTWLVSSTRYGMLLLLAMAMPLILAGRFVLNMWVGRSYALHTTLIMQVLVVANVVRLSFLPYATLLLGIGEQRKVVMSPIAEGVTNLVASVVGAWLFGAIGVAVGTLIGSFVSVTIHFVHNMPRTTGIDIDRYLLLREGLLRPLVCAVPFTLLLVSQGLSHGMESQVRMLLLGLAIVSTCYLLWNFGLIRADRQKFDAAFHA